MKTRYGSRLRETLSQVSSLPPPRPCEEFWEDFRARAALTFQEAPGRAAAAGSRLASWRWALAAAALVVMLAAAVTFLRPPAGPVQVAVALPASSPALSTVQEVEVFSDYSSVMILEDSQNGGTLILIASARQGNGPQAGARP